MPAIEKLSAIRLRGLHPGLVACMTEAIETMPYLVRVTCGLRDPVDQAVLVRLGKSRTLKSKHFRQSDGYGHAADVVAIIDGEADWGPDRFFEFAENVRAVSKRRAVDITWGMLWDTPLGAVQDQYLHDAVETYVAKFLLKHKRRPFADYPHFQFSH